MSLYGDSNTVKGYAFVSLEDKTVVGTGLLDVAKSDAKALNSAVESYIDALEAKGVANSVDKNDVIVDENQISSSDTADKPETESVKISGEVTDIKSSVNDGNTVYYFQINGKYYYVKVTSSMEALLVKKGDTIEFTINKADEKLENFIPAQNLEIK